MVGKMEVRIASDAWNNLVKVLICQKLGDGRTAVVRPTNLILDAIEEGTLVEPSFQITPDIAQELFVALAEALDERGIKTDSDAKIAGTLEATREHLKDLQKIVFKEKK